MADTFGAAAGCGMTQVPEDVFVITPASKLQRQLTSMAIFTNVIDGC